jgi:hypothetical protein
MTDIKETIRDLLKKKRPNLSEGSVRTYISLVSNFYKNDLDFDFESDKQRIVALDKPQTRKTLCSALFVLSGDNRYKELMIDDVKLVNDIYKGQERDKSVKSKSYEEITEIHKELERKLSKNPSIDNYVNLIISYLCSGVLPELPPRRILDYSLMKLRNFDKEKDNYIDKKTFVFNLYKTATKYGRQIVEIPPPLLTLINRFKKVNETDYLLITDENNNFSSSSLSRRVSKIFGVSMDTLRSIYLSHIYKDIPAVKEMEDRAYKMGHSVDSALQYYVKKDGK